MIPLTYFLIHMRYQDLPENPAPERRPWTAFIRRASWRPAQIARPAPATPALRGA